MTLLNSGFWPTTYWPENYWETSYWPYSPNAEWGTFAINAAIQQTQSADGVIRQTQSATATIRQDQTIDLIEQRGT